MSHFLRKSKKKSILLSLIIIFMVLLSQVFANAAGNDILISEVEYDPTQGGNDRNFEWFELYNPTAHNINISGYDFTDGEGAPVVIPNGTTVAAGEYFLAVFNTVNFQTEHAGIIPDLEYGGLPNANNYNLANGGDEITLRNSGGTVVDFVSWENHTAGWNIVAGAGESIERNTSADTDTAVGWDDHQAPTPGTGTLTLTNHSPNITSNGGGATVNIHVNENTTAVTTVAASDPDSGDTVSYAILDGADQAKFTINGSTGVLAFVTAQDFETPTDANTDRAYEVRVRATDGFLQDVQAISVIIDNVNEPPVITSTNLSSVSENTAGTILTTVATDPEGGMVNYSIVGGVDATSFNIAAVGGDIKFNTAPDFENPIDVDADNIYNIQVRATDLQLNNSITQNVAITVTDINDAPDITTNLGGATAAINVAENQISVTIVGVIDEDVPAQTITYSITGGADQVKFSIDSTTGVLTFQSAPDFENPQDVDVNNTYIVEVTATDDGAGTLTDIQTITITVTDVLENAVASGHSGKITSSSISGKSAKKTCKDSRATNFSNVGQHDPSLCIFPQKKTVNIQAEKKGDDRLAKRKDSNKLAKKIGDDRLAKQCTVFNKNLRKGSRGEEVKKVQSFLKEQGFFTFPKITGYFGKITKKAVLDFQVKYADEILKPLGLIKATGNWFIKTRGMANQLNDCLE